jgi:hypothetical protein
MSQTDNEKQKEQFAFNNIKIFGDAIFHTLRDLLNNYPKKDEVFKMIYKLAGSPETDDLSWGENHAFEDSYLFIAAFDLVHNGVVQL